MKRASIALFFLLIVAITARADILFYDDFENSAINSTYWSKQGGPVVTSTDQARAGSRSAKFHQDIGYVRSEIVLVDSSTGLGNADFGEERWYSWSMYLPAGTTYDAYTPLIGQWHKAGDYSCDASQSSQPLTMSLNLSGGTYYFEPFYSCESSLCGDGDWETWTRISTTHSLNTNAWNDVVIRYKPEYNTAGILQVWLNGVQIINNTSDCNAHYDPLGPQFKIGIYAAGSTNTDMTLYYDEFKVGGANSSYNEMAPGGAVNQAPAVAIDTPVGNQSIALDESLNFTCTASDSDGTISSYLWDFDDSGVAQSSSEDPGSKTFSQAGTYTVRVTVTDNDGATASDTVNVVVSAATITGLINNWQMESGAITTDGEGNEALVNNGSITSEGSGTEPTWDQGGTWGVTLNGTDQYFSVANWDASNPWQVGKPKGTFVIPIKTPATAPLLRKGLGGRWNTDGGRVVGFALSDNAGMSPQTFTGFNAGDSYEVHNSNINLSLSSRYLLVFTVDDELHTWAIYVYDAENTTWLSPATGSITNSMSLSETTVWNIGRWQTQWEYNFYYAGTIYAGLLYNTVLTEEEAHQLVSGSYTPPSPTNTFESSCVVEEYPDNTDCIDHDMVFFTGQKICVKFILGGEQNYTYDGPYSNFEWPYPLDSGSLSMLYHAGLGTNQWFFCDTVGSGDVEAGNVELVTVNDFERNRTGTTASKIVNQSGDEMDYTAPQKEADPSHKVQIYGNPNIRFYEK